MINKSEQISNLAAALLKAQQDIGVALKTATNPYFKSNYANLQVVIEAVKEPLNKHGISFLQAVDNGTEKDSLPVIDTILLHESGQYLSTRTPVFCAKPNDPQAFGSGITYSKRYALQALLGLPTDDDDGNAATSRNGDNSKDAKTPPKPTEDATKIISDTFEKYCEDHSGDVGKGFAFDAEKFKTALRVLYLKTKDSKKKPPVFDAKIAENLAKSIEPFDILSEVK